jgi:LacI family transcriptional regulator
VRGVARLAGVSISTVSRALNLPGLVDAATLARVREAMRALRYLPSGAARALRSRRSYTVGAVVPSLDNAFFSNATNALQAVLDQHGYTLLIASHRYDLGAEVRITRNLIERGAEALVFVGADHDPELFALLGQFSIPYVITWAIDRAGVHPCVGFDNRAATGRLATYLISMGHAEIAVITAPLAGNDRARERVDGVRAATKVHGLDMAKARIVEVPISFSGGSQAMASLLAATVRPTAVVCINDVFAVGAIAQCRRAGLDVPGDLSVAGFGDMEIAAHHFPSITTIRTPTLEMGAGAGAQLVARLDGSAAPAVVELEAQLIVRDSTGPAPAASRKKSPGRTRERPRKAR